MSKRALAADVPLRLWVVLARAFDAVERRSRASIARFGLGATEFGVLEALYHKGRLPVCDVQRALLIESGSTTYVVDKMVRRGLVRRVRTARDRRMILLDLTAAGRRLIARIFPPHATAMRAAVSSLTPRQQATARALLKKLGRGAAGAGSETLAHGERDRAVAERPRGARRGAVGDRSAHEDFAVAPPVVGQ